MKQPVPRILLYLVLIFFTACVSKPSGDETQVSEDNYSGSASCIECHERFYKLWAPSYHGKAMQPITSEFIQTEVMLDQPAIAMEGASYLAIKKDTSLYIREIKNGETQDYEVLWALGGKNVYYFLTPWEGGRLQTLPLAYDVNTKQWYNNPESAIRHFPNTSGAEMEDEALSWRDRQYTFNTSCYACHVSQLENNFDLATNTYETHWKEAGINCETCHGPSGEHVRVCREAGEGNVPSDLKIIVTSTFTPEQHNASCAPCHAKMRPITSSYMPGDRYFDNYDLITLENTDFYPDGRDLGENYTMTGWHMNSCQQESEMHCVTCHTSSGRYRFKSDDLVEANKACTSCHEEKTDGYEQHTHHPINKNSPKCIDCHMPRTRFGNMVRSDHSFRPPMPAASLEFGSPNACTICHSDKTDQWANRKVSQWKDRDYQKETLFIGGLIADARQGNWKQLDAMLDGIRTNKYGEIFTTSLIRLLSTCDNQKKWPILIDAVHVESPLVRSAAAYGLLGNTSDEAKKVLFQAAKDDYRLVRLAAAQSLAVLNQQEYTAEQLALFRQVNNEYEESLVTRPDDWSSYYNLGNHYQNMGNFDDALGAYENSLKIYPEAILPLVNSSFLYSVSGNQQKAATRLEQALVAEPRNEAANLNYGLLMAEMNRMAEAETALRTVLEVNEENTTAAYNLSVIVSRRDLDEACRLSKQAMDASPEDPKLSYTHAYFLNQNKQRKKAVELLEKTIKAFPDHLSSVFLLGNIYLEGGNKGKVIDLYVNASRHLQNNPQAQYQLQNEIERVKAL
ncbi:ammonia-forming cytochrome c nitrite reductase subunit c552 [Sunxiuqinia sp. sy24]|uniref:ammonia-forming cytochrome c nitrite reductase subunit c552 n=1 Tax=Sunxiuqinia sp. sy24 TaxID=3461495 RepID=UPI0040457773